MSDRTATQQIINRQMREQIEATPLYDMVVETTPRPKAYIDSLIQKLTAEMVDYDKAIHSPFSRVKIDDCGDKIQFQRIAMDKVLIRKAPDIKIDKYITGYDMDDVTIIPDTLEKEQLELTIKDGVYN